MYEDEIRLTTEQALKIATDPLKINLAVSEYERDKYLGLYEKEKGKNKLLKGWGLPIGLTIFAVGVTAGLLIN